MSEDDNSANLEEWIEPELEARVVAWVLGEASAFEAAELERLIEEKPELAVFKRRIEAVHGLIREGKKNSPKLRLSEERRKRLLQELGGSPESSATKPVVLKEKRRPSLAQRIFEIAAVFLVCGPLASMLMPSISGSLGSAKHSKESSDAKIASTHSVSVEGAVLDEPSNTYTGRTSISGGELRVPLPQPGPAKPSDDLSLIAQQDISAGQKINRGITPPAFPMTPTTPSGDLAPPEIPQDFGNKLSDIRQAQEEPITLDSKKALVDQGTYQYRGVEITGDSGANGLAFKNNSDFRSSGFRDGTTATGGFYNELDVYQGAVDRMLTKKGLELPQGSGEDTYNFRGATIAGTSASDGLIWRNEGKQFQAGLPITVNGEEKTHVAAISDFNYPAESEMDADALMLAKKADGDKAGENAIDPVVGSNPDSAGNRSGTIEIRQSTVDKLLAGQPENTPKVGDIPIQGEVFPVTPQTPVNLDQVAKVDEFEGFINYGSPIRTTSKNGETNVLTENAAGKPIFPPKADKSKEPPSSGLFSPITPQGTAEREISRRQRNVIQAGVAIEEAEDALNRKEPEVAWRKYQEAYQLVPDAMTSDDSYRKTIEGYGESSLLFAQQRVAEGRRKDAEEVLKQYLAANPNYRPASQLLQRLKDPDYYNPTVTPGFIDKVEDVKKLHREAKGFKDTGRYDLANKRYEQILNIDKYNVAARRGMEEVTYEQNKYWETAYDQTRSKLLGNVQKSWELPYRRFETIDRGALASGERDPEGTEKIRRKMASIVIPEINFANTSIRDAIEFLNKTSQSLDPDPGPDKGVNTVLQLSPPSSPQPAGGIPGIDGNNLAAQPAPVQAADPANIRITLNLKNVPLEEAMKYVTELAGLKYQVEPYAVAVLPAWHSTEVMATKEFRVPADFLASSPKSGKEAGAASPASAIEVMKAKGVDFPPGSSAILVGSNRLVIRNTQTNLDLVDALVETAKAPAEELKKEEVSARDQAFSTFSLHVSDVSFKLAKEALAAGKLPNGETVRQEEFYNAFDYGDPAPKTGEEVACRVEQSAHPLWQQRNLVRIGVKVGASGRGAGQPLRLTLLLDTSGSMEREDRAAAVKKAVEALAGLLGPNDKIAMIGFARKPRLLSDWIPGNEAIKLAEIAGRTPSEGGTNMEEALNLAGEIARKQLTPGAQNRIVLLTDGAANLGDADPEQLAARIQKLRDDGIAFDACGVGAAGLNDEILEALTRKGDGRYYLLNTAEDADTGFARQLAGAFRPAAENVKVQVRFNPSRVGKYRLIGFEEHRLKKEDFRNDKVDAAELAAEESAVALYQVETLPGGEGEIGEVFVRFREPGTENMVERSWTMMYDAKTPSFDQASATMQLAGTAALLADKLHKWPDTSIELGDLKPIVNSLRGAFPNNARVKELVTMFEQTRQILGEP